MTQSHSAQQTADRSTGEVPWNVSLLPVSRPRQPAPSSPVPHVPQVAIVVELPRDHTIQDAIRRQRRNAA